jgi:hypothetical protein
MLPWATPFLEAVARFRAAYGVDPTRIECASRRCLDARDRARDLGLHVADAREMPMDVYLIGA